MRLTATLCLASRGKCVASATASAPPRAGRQRSAARQARARTRAARVRPQARWSAAEAVNEADSRLRQQADVRLQRRRGMSGERSLQATASVSGTAASRRRPRRVVAQRTPAHAACKCTRESARFVQRRASGIDLRSSTVNTWPRPPPVCAAARAAVAPQLHAATWRALFEERLQVGGPDGVRRGGGLCALNATPGRHLHVPRHRWPTQSAYHVPG
jgi:hypothetical protein